MSKSKIRKNLTDEEMFIGYKEEVTFENTWDNTVVHKPKIKPLKKDAEKEGFSSFFTPELQEQVGKALVELKVALYKQGIIDYRLEVSREGNSVVLTAVNAVGKKKSPDKSKTKGK
ncbi:hypothetical protein Dred_1414 [Desulforamulus reducens MI-1]|uniref:Uncharacterized protein n=1 Tax=Desulforamulus reducens (strain ATCC BAA-1160 / DSM 100696 / MI-1) TaxID=349161 RepID=A4J4E1_DESRM|nr:hypothetical protein [Desulforamulus reducens]ABO49944.1 hypothetical protein Dred_1414 [Desulforamulus reducens MI-1]